MADQPTAQSGTGIGEKVIVDVVRPDPPTPETLVDIHALKQWVADQIRECTLRANRGQLSEAMDLGYEMLRVGYEWTNIRFGWPAELPAKPETLAALITGAETIWQSDRGKGALPVLKRVESSMAMPIEWGRGTAADSTIAERRRQLEKQLQQLDDSAARLNFGPVEHVPAIVDAIEGVGAEIENQPLTLPPDAGAKLDRILREGHAAIIAKQSEHEDGLARVSRNIARASRSIAPPAEAVKDAMREATAEDRKATPINELSTKPRKRKRSTERGEGRAKLIPALTKHHQYADGGCLNLEPIGNNELARLAEVSESTASAFFNKQFNAGKSGGHARYRAICGDSARLIAALKLLNQEFAPHHLFGPVPTKPNTSDDSPN